MADIQTGGGLSAGDVESSGDFVGRDSIHISTAAQNPDLSQRVRDLELAVFGDRRTGYAGAVALIDRLREDVEDLIGRQNLAQIATLGFAAISAIGILFLLLGGGR